MEICAGCTARYATDLPKCPQCGSKERVDAGTVGTVPPAVTVECAPGIDCRAAGVRRRVQLRMAAVGVVELPRLLCAVCGSELNVTWPGPADEEETMPKITRMRGPSIKGGHPPLVDSPEPEGEGGEEPSPGTSSSTSSPRSETSSAPSGSDRPKRARTTGNRSKKARTGPSTARSTAGGQAAPTSDSGSADA